MNLTKESFKTDYIRKVDQLFAMPVEECTQQQQYEALVRYITDSTAEVRKATTMRNKEQQLKKVYYFSMEFLIGRLLENYLVNLGIRDLVAEALWEIGVNFEQLCDCEADPGLGNGGLGRLAACFLDSMASLSVPGVGMGLRYNFGLFRQRIENGYQIEETDNWLDNGYPWELAKPSEAVPVHFGGKVERSFENGRLNFHYSDYSTVLAVPYDVPIIGQNAESVNLLRLWSAQQVKQSLDLNEFNQGHYPQSMADRAETEAITSVLYPNDNGISGKILRLKQEYLLVCAGMESIFRSFKSVYGSNWDLLPEKVAIHTNDTHPAMCVPELMRKLMDEEGMGWDQAWEITTKTCSFTNHTVLPEALEKWPQDMLSGLLPRIFMIIEEIDRRWKAGLKQGENWKNAMRKTAIIKNGDVRMADLSIIGSHSVNGVAKLHSDILKDSLFNDFYRISPEKFSNKTNGISHRRFLMQSNPALTRLITEAIGDGWKTNPEEMEKLLSYKDDPAFLEKLAAVKRDNKLRLASYVAATQHIEIDPDSVFDVQVKRIHAYKRQLLAALKVLNLYNMIRENPDLDINNYTFVFSGKAAPGYIFAKEIIKFICSIADKVNADPVVSKRIKVVFIENFCVSNAQLIYPAADISEQISTAGKEASGTGNMKFMMNGAVTLGTLDGANVEIRDLVGDDNMKIFGLTAEQTENYAANGGYNPHIRLQQDERLGKMCNQLVDGFFDESSCKFWGIFDEFTKHGDEYFVLEDFAPYTDAWKYLDGIYKDRMRWNSMALVNIAKSGYFSSDRTIKEYADEIWHTRCK